MTSIQSESHRRLTQFVDWIRPPEDTEDKIRAQSEEIRGRIKGQAHRAGLVVRSTPNSGSFAKRTGLRRHWNPAGGSPVEGQDVDLPFVVSPATKDGEQLDSLLARFESYAQASYPNTTRMRTKSSIQLDFTGSKLRYDLVPLLATDKDDEQILVRADGERRRTSIQKHIEFVRRRTAASGQQPGRVKFNECVRLLKWWREFRVADDTVLKAVPTIVIDLLAAKVFDIKGVESTYTDTLLTWFEELARIVRMRERVVFNDYYLSGMVRSATRWQILDPTNPDNDVIPRDWSEHHFRQLQSWFEQALADMQCVIRCEAQGDLNHVVHDLCKLFGSPFKHHSEAGR